MAGSGLRTAGGGCGRRPWRRWAGCRLHVPRFPVPQFGEGVRHRACRGGPYGSACIPCRARDAEETVGHTRGIDRIEIGPSCPVPRLCQCSAVRRSHCHTSSSERTRHSVERSHGIRAHQRPRLPVPCIGDDLDDVSGWERCDVRTRCQTGQLTGAGDRCQIGG